MAKQFEDLIAWQKARALTNAVYNITRNGDFPTDFGLKDQIQRAAVSVMSNIAEGYARQTDKQWLYFLEVAWSSASEVRSLLYVTLDLGYIDKNRFNQIKKLATETISLIAGLRRSTKAKKGLKYSQKLRTSHLSLRTYKGFSNIKKCCCGRMSFVSSQRRPTTRISLIA